MNEAQLCFWVKMAHSISVINVLLHVSIAWVKKKQTKKQKQSKYLHSHTYTLKTDIIYNKVIL